MSLGSIARKVLDVSPLDILRYTRNRVFAHGAVRGANLDSEQEVQLLLMRKDLRDVGPPYSPSEHWQRVVKVFDELFHTQGIGNPEEQAYNLRFSGFVASDPRLHRYVCWMYYKILEKRDPLGLLRSIKATCQAGNGYGYTLDDRVLSLDLLLSIDDFYSLYELNAGVATEPVVVAELGAGWGRLGYVLCKANPRSTYVVFDLPEVLLISQTYLPTLLPDKLTCRYSEAREHGRLTPQILRSKNLWFFGAQHMERFEPGSVDTVVNIASFQEMPKDYVASYMQVFSRIARGGSCFLRQLKSGRSHSHTYDEIEGFDAYPIPSDWHQVFSRSSTLNDQFLEAGYRINSGTLGEKGP
jgi:putative sugar O-methyltransferase